MAEQIEHFNVGTHKGYVDVGPFYRRLLIEVAELCFNHTSSNDELLKN